MQTHNLFYPRKAACGVEERKTKGLQALYQVGASLFHLVDFTPGTWAVRTVGWLPDSQWRWSRPWVSGPGRGHGPTGLSPAPTTAEGQALLSSLWGLLMVLMTPSQWVLPGASPRLLSSVTKDGHTFKCLKQEMCPNLLYRAGWAANSQLCCCCYEAASVMSDSVRPHRRQPTRRPRPWDSPGKNTGVGWHFLLQCVHVKSESEVAQSCPTRSDPMDCSPRGSSVHGIFQARVLEWVAMAFSEFPALWGTIRGGICRVRSPLCPGWPSVPCALLHCGADELADQRQELLRVPGVKLLQQGEQPQHQGRPVHGVGGLSADHSCEDRQTTGYTTAGWGGLLPRSFRMNVHKCQDTGAHMISGRWLSGGNDNPGPHFELDPGLVEASSALMDSTP